MIFIAYNYENKPISIVNAKSKELAYAYWQGKDILPHSHKCVEEDFTKLDNHPTGVYPIMETEEVNSSKFGDFNQRDKKLIIVK